MDNKKNYVIPVMEIVLLSASDIIASSGPDTETEEIED